MHTLGALSKSTFHEIPDAASDFIEFYTPRVIARPMVAVTNLRLGETVLAPASGSQGAGEGRS